MAITRQNINTQQMPPDYNKGCNCCKKEQEKTITIYKNRKAAEDVISRMTMPIGAIDVVYYRDSNRNLKCLIVVGGMPHTPPFIFENSSYVTTTDGSDSGSSSGGGSDASKGSSDSSGDSSASIDDYTWDGDFDSSTISWDIIVTPDDDESEHVLVPVDDTQTWDGDF